jgi:DeoR family transcriptional regulator of aga operon
VTADDDLDIVPDLKSPAESETAMDTMESRREAICALVNERKNVTFAEIKEAFPQVSDMTIRTDLRVLDEKKRIVRIHGGAKSVETLLANDDVLGTRSVRNVDEKKLIARKAVKLIRPNMTIFVDSGSTTTQMCSIIPDIPCFIMTNSISCAAELIHLTQAKVVITGGMMNRNSLSITGFAAAQTIASVNFDIAFIGATTYRTDIGFACGSGEDNIIKQQVIGRSERNVILLDSSKLGKKSSFTTCMLDEVDCVVSDDRISEKFAEECRQSGVELL